MIRCGLALRTVTPFLLKSTPTGKAFFFFLLSSFFFLLLFGGGSRLEKRWEDPLDIENVVLVELV